jgi:peptidyl-prolyl cis-trans isomerase SurA
MTLRSARVCRAGLSALAVLASLTALPVQAQGLRVPPQLGSSAARPAAVAQRQADYIVAVVNSEPITNNEVRARLVRVEQEISQRGGAVPPRAELLRQVLDALISEKAQLHLAREFGLRVEDAAVDQAELTVANQNQIDRTELHRRLVLDGIPLVQFREDLRNQLLVNRLREREIEPRVRVTDADVDQFLREQAGNSTMASLELNLAMVLVAVPENSSAAQIAALQARAERVAERARGGDDFAALVREFSNAPDRDKNGGLLGLRSAERYPPLFVEAVQKLRPGEVTGPVRSAAGFHILKVIEKRQGGQPGMTLTQTRARHILLRPSAQMTESAARTRLADFKRRIQAGQADFAVLARENSQDGSAREGGDLGWTNPGQFVPEFEEVMNRLAPGQVSDPLVSRFGVHLIQVVERREATLSQREQRELVRSQVREQKLDEAFATWAQEVRGRAYVEMREPPQ